MYSFSSLSASSILQAHIRQDIALIFVSRGEIVSWYQNWKKCFYPILACIAFFSYHPSSTYAQVSEEKDFIVTAYYSPLPDQSFYLKGNYEAEKTLNGNGTHGASGKPVFAGMIAAPKTYAFGTRIEFDGIGVGIVEDRGGAIVPAGERGQAYDRIDIWMGYGEEGLRRALIWGKRKVHARIISDTRTPVLDLKNFDNGKIDLSQFARAINSPTKTGLDRDILDMFSDLGYPKEDGQTEKDMIIEFQLDHGIIRSHEDDGAGVYGPKTRAALREAHDQYKKLRDEELGRIEREKSLLLSEKTAWENTYRSTVEKITALKSPARGERGDHVRELQVTLRSTAYFKGKDTGIMGPSTIMAIKSLQKAHGITASGSLDARTREVLVEAVMEGK